MNTGAGGAAGRKLIRRLRRFGSSQGHLIESARADGAAINPEKVGCMAGEMLGLSATGNGTDSQNCAGFDWAEMK